MSVSDDVGNLFRRFGGDAGQYQEVTRDDDAKHAALRWPLLNALDIAHTEPVPGAGRPAAPATSLGKRVEPAVQPSPSSSSAQTAAPPDASESTVPARPPLFARGHRHASMPPPVAPAQVGASRFSPAPSVAPAADRTNAAANAPTMAAAPSAPSVPSVPSVQIPVAPVEEPARFIAPATAVAPSAPQPSQTLRETAPQRPAQPIPAAPFLAGQQTFARAPISRPVTESPRVAPQQGGSILAGLFGGKNAPQPGVPANAPSKDLSSLFARLSHGSAAPARSLRDTFKTRFKADGDA